MENLTPEQLERILAPIWGGNKGLYIGPWMLGLFADALLLGVCIAQIAHWWSYSRPDERPIVKYLVYYLSLTSIAITIYILVWMFEVFVYNFGKYASFVDASWQSTWAILNIIVRIPVQVFFAERAYRMCNESKLYAGTIGFLLFTSTATGICIKVLSTPQYSYVSTKLIYVWIGCEILNDFITTVTIAWFLFRSKTGWSGTDRLISRLLRLMAETQFPPTVNAIVFVIAVLTTPVSTLSLFFIYGPKLYFLCLLVVLNSRHALRLDLSQEQEFTSGNKQSFALRGMQLSRNGATSQGINVTTETYTHVTRDNVKPTRSVNRGPFPPDTASGLEVDLEEDGDMKDDGLDSETRFGSAVGLTGLEKGDGKGDRETTVRFGQ